MAEDYGKDKVESTGSGDGMRMRGGGDSGENCGPTGSSRHYPKGKSVRKTDWNPIKGKASTYGIDGV